MRFTLMVTNYNHVCEPHSKSAHTWVHMDSDLAVCKESDGDVLGALLRGTLSKIQIIIETGYIVLRTYYVRARVIIGGHSSWLRHFMGLSTHFGVYFLATWCRELQNIW